MKPRIAVVDDEERMAQVTAMVLRREGYEVEPWSDPVAALRRHAQEPYDLVLSDLKMPKIDGLELLERVKRDSPDTPVILFTAHGDVDSAIAAMKRGAADYLMKPVDNDHCRAVVARTLSLTRLSRENRYLRAELRERFGLDAIIAQSEPMRDVLDLARRAAASTSTVLLGGESGTGKEVVARAIHFHSTRVGAAFVAVNCKAFAEGVIESEFFGHEKGAFTGASARRAGVFERAHGGTLFLDEIGELGSDLQAKLLRVLQEREVQRVGGDAPVPVDVRVIAATHRDLRAEIEAGRFREDLYFRLAVIPITLPPLRERRDDVLPLARALLERHNRAQDRRLCGWEPAVEAALLHHDFPGNVRELENCIERAVVLARGELIEVADLGLGDVPPERRVDDGPNLQEHLDRAAAEHIRSVLSATGGARQEAARRLGIERTTLYRLMKRYGIS